MDLNMLKQKNQLQQINEETRDILTEPYRPILITLKEEQYNALVNHAMMVGEQIVRNTDSVSKLPTQETVTNMIYRSIRPQLERMNKDIVCGRQSIEAKLEKALKEQTRSLEQRLQMERTNLEEQIRARDLSPMKLRLKWMLIGAILPTAYLIRQLIFK